jgi:DNA-binding transcriptional MerR regulator
METFGAVAGRTTLAAPDNVGGFDPWWSQCTSLATTTRRWYCEKHRNGAKLPTTFDDTGGADNVGCGSTTTVQQHPTVREAVMNGMTIEDLAEQADVKVSTIRMYQHRQLLPAPTMRGRVGVYDDGHLARLRLIQRLQEQGFSLAGIHHLVDAWERGRSLGDLLDEGDSEVAIDSATLASMFPDATDPAVLERLKELGVARRSGDQVILDNDRLVRVGRALAGANVPLDAVLDLAEQVEVHTAHIADAFVELFTKQVWRPWIDGGMQGDALAELLDRLAQLRGLGVEVVAAAMRDAIDRAAERAVADRAGDLTGDDGHNPPR